MRSFYSPLSISAPFYGYLKLQATRKGKESKQGCKIRESNSGPLAPRPRTNRLCHPCSYSIFMDTVAERKSRIYLFVTFSCKTQELAKILISPFFNNRPFKFQRNRPICKCFRTLFLDMTKGQKNLGRLRKVEWRG